MAAMLAMETEKRERVLDVVVSYMYIACTL
jgi:hypothetical protein